MLPLFRLDIEMGFGALLDFHDCGGSQMRCRLLIQAAGQNFGAKIPVKIQKNEYLQRFMLSISLIWGQNDTKVQSMTFLRHSL